ncbi:MAG: DUF308 domain-containing protein [Christensenellales bacterium]|jgi:uncharacterized membrane protein HdeD (DUF308 family)
MKSNQKGMPWWLAIIIGVLIIAAGIFLLVSPSDGRDVLIFIVGLGVLLYSLYNFYRAIQSRDDNRIFIPFLAHGLLDIVLFLLILFINKSPALLSVILSCWLIVFGLFGIIHARQDGGDNHRRIRINTFLMLIGLGLLIIPFILSIDPVVFLGIIALAFGVMKTIQGIISKVRLDESTSGGRSNLL